MGFTWHVVNLNNCVVLLCFSSMIEVHRRFLSSSSSFFFLNFNCDHAIATFIMTFDTTCHIDMDEMGLIFLEVAHERAT